VGVPSPDDASDNFDFVFRFFFTDQTESTRQWRYLGADVANTSNFDPFAAVMRFNEDTSAFSFQTIDQAPPGAVTNPIDINIGISSVSNKIGPGSAIYFNIVPPAVADRVNWYGVKLRSRIIPDSRQVVAFENTDYFPVPQPVAGVWQMGYGMQYDLEYQYILTPIVNVNGVQSEARFSWIGRGAIHNRQAATDYPSNGNWLTKLNFTRIETTSIPGIASTPISGGQPVPKVSQWQRVQSNNNSPDNPNTTYFSLSYNTDHIEGCLGVYLYRRAFTTQFQTSWGKTNARYYGLGRWERVSLGKNGSGLTFRAPISWDEFHSYYGLPGQTVPLIRNTFPWTSTAKVLQNLTGINSSPATGWQYYLVAYTAAGEVTIGTMLPVIQRNLTTSPDMPTVVERSTLNGYDSGFQRNLSDYRTQYQATNLLDTSFKAYTGGRA
jgi:hypothetical protein